MMVSVTGFEPVASCTPCTRAARLRQTERKKVVDADGFEPPWAFGHQGYSLAQSTALTSIRKKLCCSAAPVLGPCAAIVRYAGWARQESNLPSGGDPLCDRCFQGPGFTLRGQDSNLRSTILKRDSNPPTRQLLPKMLVGTVRLELTASCTPCTRATRLRYAPKMWLQKNRVLLC